ncbi:MAG: CGNR zinc finger domain-containing protein [Nocardioidaceae bacterium]
MHWVEVDGLQMPRRYGGHPALDFCNTWAGWGEPPKPTREWLRSYAHLVVWARHAELVDPGDVDRLRALGDRRADAGAEQVVEARRLRALLRKAVLHPTDRRAMAGVTGFVRRAATAVRLQPAADPRWEIPSSAGLAIPLLAVSWSAGELLTSGRLGAVRCCPGTDCGWLFLDQSGRRRWCSMSACGNRAKVRAHAARQRRH